jgi:hypothetical protein
MPFSIGKFWNRLWPRILTVVVIASLFVVGGLISGKAGDCSVGQSDGQCGLSTFVGLINGLVAGGVVLLLGTIVVLLQWNYAKRASEQK